VKILALARNSVAAIAICNLIACAPAAQVEREVDTSKIPITTTSDEAFDAFLMGRWLLENLRVTDAHEYFLKATKADPEFALAHLRLANTASTNQEIFDARRRETGHRRFRGRGLRKPGSSAHQARSACRAFPE
jgi:Tfp pilus assembly protein PilF